MRADRVYVDLQMELSDFTLDVQLDLPGQGVTVLFGQSGSGKTTLLRCLAGLEKAQGRIVVKGDCWQDGRYFMPVHKRSLGYVFQHCYLFPHLTVRSNLNYGLKRVRLPNLDSTLDQAIELLGIGHLLERRPGKLSGGERQRVAIAQALAMSPRILLMDEPMAALDRTRKQEIMPYLERLHDDLRLPIVYVTHAVDELRRLADHLVVLQQGRVIASGETAEVLSAPDMPISRGEEAGALIEAVIAQRDTHHHLALAEFTGGQLWTRDMGHQTGTKVRLWVLARDVSVALEPPGDSSILNLMPATVEELGDSEHPAIKLLRARVGDTCLLSRISSRSVEGLGLSAGKSVWLQVKSVALVE